MLTDWVSGSFVPDRHRRRYSLWLAEVLPEKTRSIIVAYDTRRGGDEVCGVNGGGVQVGELEHLAVTTWSKLAASIIIPAVLG
jgi:translation initiation factor 1 (eIF-1/SUI1)